MNSFKIQIRESGIIDTAVKIHLIVGLYRLLVISKQVHKKLRYRKIYRPCSLDGSDVLSHGTVLPGVWISGLIPSVQSLPAFYLSWSKSPSLCHLCVLSFKDSFGSTPADLCTFMDSLYYLLISS